MDRVGGTAAGSGRWLGLCECARPDRQTEADQRGTLCLPINGRGAALPELLSAQPGQVSNISASSPLGQFIRPRGLAFKINRLIGAAAVTWATLIQLLSTR